MIACTASSAEDTRSYFSGHYGLERGETAQCRCPFLKPDNQFRADLAFGLRLENGVELLFLAQCKLWNTPHGPPEVEEELWKISPEGFNADGQYDSVVERFPAEGDFVSKRPRAGKPTKPKEISYERYPPKYRIVRVFVAFSDMYDANAKVFGTQAIGCYPLAVLSKQAMEMAGKRFSPFLRAVERVRATEDRKKQAAVDKKEAKAAKVAAEREEAEERGLRRSPRFK
ncbi:hypothetical protein AURDEDRAFT_147355 [Auricularia subglabra TFB-10046 SS5]|nr:hypothetical protein AURDEDRAFT_147355 [Auricularia subglabra TFB-10046 SS5]